MGHFGLLLLIAILSICNSQEHSHLLPHVTPLHYDIEIHAYNFSSLIGITTIKMNITNISSGFILNSRVKPISTVQISNNTHTFDLADIEQVHADYGPGYLRFDFKTDLFGVYCFTMAYECTDIGTVSETYENDQQIKVPHLFTHLEPNYARYLFPCFDEPSFKATFNISVIHPNNFTALSNSPVKKVIPINGTFFVETFFEQTPPMSTYLVAIFVSDFASVSNAGKNFSVWASPHRIDSAHFALNFGQNVLKVMEEYTGIPYQMKKLDVVAIPTFHKLSAMENWGLIFSWDKLILSKPNSSLNVSEQDLYYWPETHTTIVHEIVHQWFGNLVSPKQWVYMWLNEGFAQYLTFYITDKLYPQWGIMEEFVVKYQQNYVLTNDSKANFTHPLYVSDKQQYLIERNSISWIMYMKGCATVRMMQHFLTEKVFQQGLQHYLRKFSYKAVDFDDLFEALDIVADKSNALYGKSIKTIMTPWLTQISYPVITVTRNYNTGTVNLSQSTFLFREDGARIINNNKWWVPINFATEENPDFKKTTPTTWLEPQVESLTMQGIVKSNHWIIVNKLQTGLYRVNYDTKNWNMILKYLESSNESKIHIMTQAQLVNDALAFLKVGMLNINESRVISIRNRINSELLFNSRRSASEDFV